MQYAVRQLTKFFNGAHLSRCFHKVEQAMEKAGCYVIEHWCAAALREEVNCGEKSFNSETNHPCVC